MPSWRVTHRDSICNQPTCGGNKKDGLVSHFGVPSGVSVSRATVSKIGNFQFKCIIDPTSYHVVQRHIRVMY